MTAPLPSASPSASPPALTYPHRNPNNQPTHPNIANAVLGNLHIKPWYPSFYPEDLRGGRDTDRLYICGRCFKYTHEIMRYSAHCKACPLRDEQPPGERIYKKDGYAIHRLDGEEHKLYAQNLSLFAKLFLDTKSVFFDVNTFLYYTLVLQPSHVGTLDNSSPQHGQVVGFFSKEKMSWDNNNVACILIFPPWQRRGLGQILMGASYILGRREGRFGGPEKPLSKLGRRAYIAYWSGEIYRYILRLPARKTVTVREISEATWIVQEDVLAALRDMGVVEVEGRKNAAGGRNVVVVRKERVREWGKRFGVGVEGAVDVVAFVGEESGGREGDVS